MTPTEPLGERFWEQKSLAQMNRVEWEALCDGCAQCCRVKLEDEDSGWIAVTHAVCRLLDQQQCRCTSYPDRHRQVPDCIRFDAQAAATLSWLPETCAYRLLALGQPLPAWHPLVSGDPESVHRAGMSVRGKVISETELSLEELQTQVLHWVDPATGTAWAPDADLSDEELP